MSTILTTVLKTINFRAKFSERLKELRLEKGLSQTAISKATGLSQNDITQWENEKRVPNANAVILLANYFEVTAGYILGTKGLIKV